MPWPRRASRIREVQLQRENDGLKTVICCLRREIENKQGAVQRLEVLLCERLTRIDQLVARQVLGLWHRAFCSLAAVDRPEMVRWPAALRVAAEPPTKPMEQGQ